MKSIRNILILILGLLALSYFVKPLRSLQDIFTFNFFKKSDDGKNTEIINEVASKVKKGSLSKSVQEIELYADRLHMAMRLDWADIPKLIEDPGFDAYFWNYHWLTIQEVTDSLNATDKRAVFAAFGSKAYGNFWEREHLTLDKWFQRELSLEHFAWVTDRWSAAKIWSI